MVSQTDYINLEVIQEAGQVLVTGTDTGIGKTWTTVKIIEGLRHAGREVFAVKPLETGCESGINDQLVGADISKIAAALDISSDQPDYQELYFQLFRSPVAPAVAVKREDSTFDWSELVSWLKEQKSKRDLLLVEGAGGLLVPIAENRTYAELATETALKTLVVFGSRLGAINQAALTFEVLRARGLPVLGYVFNEISPAETALEGTVNADQTNRELLKEVAARYEINEIGYLSWEVK